MLKTLLFSIGILITTFSSAQLQSDFHCTGSGLDANCGGFADISNPGSSSIVNWLWDFGNGQTSNLQNPENICFDSTGSYTVCLTTYDAIGDSSKKCKQNYMSRDSLGVHCNYFVGMNEILNYDFQIYPNPVTEKITFSLNDSQEADVVIYDLASRRITHKIFFNSIILNTNQLPKGIYFFQLTTKNSFIYSGKFLKVE